MGLMKSLNIIKAHDNEPSCEGYYYITLVTKGHNQIIIPVPSTYDYTLNISFIEL